MIKIFIVGLLPLALSACQTTQSYSVPLKHYFSDAMVPARIESISSLRKVCADEFVLDRKTGTLIGVILGTIASNGLGMSGLLATSTGAYTGVVGYDAGKSQEPKNNGFHKKCLPEGYEVRISYYHPDNNELISHYIVMDKRVQHSTVNIPISWVPML